MDESGSMYGEGEMDSAGLRYEAAESLMQNLLVTEAHPAFPYRTSVYYLGHTELASVVDALSCNLLCCYFQVSGVW